MNRRGFISASVAFLAMPAYARADDARSEDAPADEAGPVLYWTIPGGNPFGKRPFSVARQLFEERGLPPRVLDALQEEVDNERYVDTTIEDQSRWLMVFGSRTTFCEFIVALPSHWPAWVSKAAQLYTCSVGGQTYRLLHPEVCGNWALQSREDKTPLVFGPTAYPVVPSVPEVGPVVWGWPPTIPTYFYYGGGGGGHKCKHHDHHHCKPRPSNVPEPGGLLMFLTALAAFVPFAMRR